MPTATQPSLHEYTAKRTFAADTGVPTSSDDGRANHAWGRDAPCRIAIAGVAHPTSAAAVALLSDTGYDPAFGARPVKRAVQSLLETAVAQAILRGDVNEDQTAVVDVSADVPGKLSVVAEGVPSAGTTDVVV